MHITEQKTSLLSHIHIVVDVCIVYDLNDFVSLNRMKSEIKHLTTVFFTHTI